MKRPETRPATAADFRQFYGRPVPYTAQAQVAVLDGRIIAVWGVYFVSGQEIVFSDFTEEAKRFRRDIVREGRAFVARLRGHLAKAVCDPRLPTAEQFLAHFGFRHTSECAHGKVFELLG